MLKFLYIFDQICFGDMDVVEPRSGVYLLGLWNAFCVLFCKDAWKEIVQNFGHKSEQLTAGCIAIFHKYVVYKKHGGIMTNLTLENPWEYVTDMSKFHDVGVWSMD